MEIADPIFGYDARSHSETAWDTPGSVVMMTVDNLPNELPRDASQSFGEQFIENILPELEKERSAILDRATIASGGALTNRYAYLADYVA